MKHNRELHDICLRIGEMKSTLNFHNNRLYLNEKDNVAPIVLEATKQKLKNKIVELRNYLNTVELII
jgi:hypothetical protein